MNAAVAASEALRSRTAGIRLSVQQVVRDGAEEHCYVVRVDDGSVTVEPGRDVGADVTVTEDLETAAALSRGDLTPQVAFMTGRVRVSGDMATLMRSYEALADADEVF